MKNIKPLLLTIFFSTLFLTNSKAQIKYAGKVESGYLTYLTNTNIIDGDPDWKGYYINDSQNGIDLSFINGIKISEEKLFLGVGLSYLNFEGYDGFSTFADLELANTQKVISPLFNLKVGISQLYNQYSGGTLTGLTAFNFGLKYRINNKNHIYLKTGLLFTQQSMFFPINFGYEF
jgi:hypothetical protein